MGKEAITKELEKRRIPELLRLSDNTPVDTPQLWETRRKEIRDILQKECYGYIPGNRLGNRMGNRIGRGK